MGRGPQLQNVPKAARAIFCAAPGHALVQGDLRRAEAMFVAYDSQEQALIDIFRDPTRDLYKETAARAMSIPLAEVQAWLREVFKRVIHASNYGMGPLKFITVLRLAGINIEDLEIRGIVAPTKKSEYLIESYHATYPNIRRWHASIREEVRRTRILHDAFGRRRTFLDRMDDSLFRKAFSYRPQASIVSVTNQGLVRLHEQGEVIVAQTHDSICTEVGYVDQADITRGARRLVNAMSTPITLHGVTFTIPTDVQWGLNWGEMKSVDLS